ncbi:MAG: hypothetical protein MK213_08755, partial [Planctomycetes bacterium]|nr:hypothetical protein [Planctomycetota bacterium]
MGDFPQVKLQKWLRGPRVFQADIRSAPRNLDAGEQVEVIDGKGDLCGYGLWHPTSMISVRMMRDDAPLD